eukprot:TRINITY_DN16367_c0_g1_i1.p1 TRINITY_DN16367_c0_g1~~TRINITY_DN16367_c0_g1_i1.p1  ORF type:complete len:139 (+),score=10.62 TRINITY_DN16367_c0_g1_i1:60-476(+)
MDGKLSIEEPKNSFNIEGYVYRKEHSIIRSNHWKKRYISLKNSTVNVFESEGEYQAYYDPVGTLPLHGSCLIQEYADDSSKTKKKKFCFLVTNLKDTWVLAVTSEEEKKNWMETLNRNIHFLDTKERKDSNMTLVDVT